MVPAVEVVARLRSLLDSVLGLKMASQIEDDKDVQEATAHLVEALQTNADEIERRLADVALVRGRRS